MPLWISFLIGFRFFNEERRSCDLLFFCVFRGSKKRHSIFEEKTAMLYLINTIYKQSIALPILATHSDYTLMLQDVLDDSWHEVNVASADKGTLSYNIFAELPEGLHRGEYLCVLSRGGKVVAKALAFVGEYQQGIEYLQRSEDVVLTMYAESVEYVQMHTNVSYLQKQDRIEYIQHAQSVDFLEYEEQRGATLDIMPEQIFLMPGNNFTDDVFVLANVVWEVS